MRWCHVVLVFSAFPAAFAEADVLQLLNAAPRLDAELAQLNIQADHVAQDDEHMCLLQREAKRVIEAKEANAAGRKHEWGPGNLLPASFAAATNSSIIDKDELVSKTVSALALGVVSGISMPIGVWLGKLLYPVSDQFCSSILAFGAGSLLFAVTVAIYGKMLREHVSHAYKYAMIAGGAMGAFIFIAMDRWLEHYLSYDPAEAENDNVSCSASMSDNEASETVSEASAPLSDGTSRLERHSLPSPSPEYRFGTPPVARPRRMSEGAVDDAFKLQGKNYHFEGRGSKGIVNMVALNAVDSVEHDAESKSARGVAIALFLGLLIDGVPEGIFMGFLAAEDKLSLVLVTSLFIANFPEALSSALLLEKAHMSFSVSLLLWGGLCLLVGSLCGVSCYMILRSYPEYAWGKKLPQTGGLIVALVEGLTGGAMLACISAVMLPDAMKRAGSDVPVWRSSGFLCVLGFLASVLLEVCFPAQIDMQVSHADLR